MTTRPLGERTGKTATFGPSARRKRATLSIVRAAAGRPICLSATGGLRAVHELKEKHPDNEDLLAWGKAGNALCKEAVRYREKHREARQEIRTAAQHRYERKLLDLCRPFLGKDVPQRVLCQRVERSLPELFTFVADPRLPPDNNAAERAVRPLTVCRKISGGTRSPLGSQTKSTLASIFYTWRLRDIQPFLACPPQAGLPPTPHFPPSLSSYQDTDATRAECDDWSGETSRTGLKSLFQKSPNWPSCPSRPH